MNALTHDHANAHAEAGASPLFSAKSTDDTLLSLDSVGVEEYPIHGSFEASRLKDMVLQINKNGGFLCGMPAIPRIHKTSEGHVLTVYYWDE